MGVGCSCAIENVNRPTKKIYSCIIATANHVVTKDIEERIPRYGDVLEPIDMCMDTCDYLFNDELEVIIPFNTYSCSEEGSVPDANGFCVPCHEQIRDCEFCAGDDTCLACLPEGAELTIFNLYNPVAVNGINLCREGCVKVYNDDYESCKDCIGHIDLGSGASYCDSSDPERVCSIAHWYKLDSYRIDYSSKCVTDCEQFDGWTNPEPIDELQVCVCDESHYYNLDTNACVDCSMEDY